MSKETTGKKKLTEIIPLKTRIRLLVVWGIVILFMLFGYLSGDSMSPLVATATFLILLLTITFAASGVVGEADELAHKLGEPYGTLILTLSILSIEVILIAAMMLILTLLLSLTTFSGKRTTPMVGVMHLVLFATFIMLIFNP